jgi:hypothetical protein
MVMFESTKVRNIFFVLLALLIVCAGVIFYMYSQINTLKSNPEEKAKDEVAEVIEKVGKLTVLPSDEEPTIATVTNLDRLKDQAFFTNAQIGDKVLIYQASRKAILYNPTTNKIVEISSINLNNPSSTSENTSTTTVKNN